MTDAGQPAPTDAGQPAPTFTYLRGVNSINFDFTTGWGQDYGPGITSVTSYKFLADRGHKLIRLPVTWGPNGGSHELQPQLGAPLDPEYVRRLHQELDNIAAAGLVAVLDVHSSCRYPDSNSPAVCGNGITLAQVQDLWTRLSAEFESDPAVVAYDLMNEPHDMAAGVWQQFSQAMVDAIRARGDMKLLWVEGVAWSSAGNWGGLNGPPWIHDSANNILYSAHTYPDTSAGGNWTQSAYSMSDETMLSELADFTNWCAQYNQRCGIGEVNFASNAITADWPSWNALAERWYQAADAAGLTVTYYDASSTQVNPNDVYVHGGGNDVVLNTKPLTLLEIDTALSPATVLERHPSR